jgi:hypothetical protein
MPPNNAPRGRASIQLISRHIRLPVVSRTVILSGARAKPRDQRLVTT